MAGIAVAAFEDSSARALRIAYCTRFMGSLPLLPQLQRERRRPSRGTFLSSNLIAILEGSPVHNFIPPRRYQLAFGAADVWALPHRFFDALVLLRDLFSSFAHIIFCFSPIINEQLNYVLFPSTGFTREMVNS